MGGQFAVLVVHLATDRLQNAGALVLWGGNKRRWHDDDVDGDGKRHVSEADRLTVPIRRLLTASGAINWKRSRAPSAIRAPTCVHAKTRLQFVRLPN